MQGSAPITSLSETSSDPEDSDIDNNNMMDMSTTESVFITGVLDELKVCFNYNSMVTLD